MRIAAPEPTPAAVDAAAMEKAFDASSAFAAQQTLQAMQDAVGYASASNVVLQRIAARAGVPADQAAMLAARLGASAAWIADRQRVIARAQLAAPAPIADAWTLHGFVIDGQNRAVAGARVQLVDGVTPVPGARGPAGGRRRGPVGDAGGAGARRQGQRDRAARRSLRARAERGRRARRRRERAGRAMSNSRGIAAVTATIASILRRVTQPLPGGDVIDADITSINFTQKPPDRARLATDPRTNQLNLFLYSIQPNAAMRNMELDGGGAGQASLPLALNLYYLVTAYGEGDDDLKAHRLLGRAMALLHQNGILATADIKAALVNNDLYQQIERIRITPQPIGYEEMSKMWTMFQAAYAITVAYEATVVLIQNPQPAITPIPVLRRGPNDAGPDVFPDLVPRWATLTSVTIPNGQPAARLGSGATPGDTITLDGFELMQLGKTTLIHFDHLRQDVHLALPPTTSAPGRLTLTLPNDQVNFPAGPYALSVELTSATDPQRISNALPISIAPRISNFVVGALDVNGNLPITASFSPEVWPDQEAVLIVDAGELPADGMRGGEQVAVTFLGPPPPSGTHFVRARVDGVESLLIDYTASPIGFDPSQRITIP
jgi:hypothetical protein